MATNFPGSQDSFTNPTSSDTLDSPDHAAQHADVNDAVEAIELALLDGAPLKIDDANERVGIGTTAPAEELHILKDQNGDMTQVLIENLDQRVRIGSYYELGVGQYGKIQSEQDAGGDVALVLNPEGGNVGIGTSSPQTRLGVSGDIDIVGNDRSIVFGRQSETGPFGLEVWDSGAIQSSLYYRTTPDAWSFENSSGTDILTVDIPNQRVGIGDSTPSYKLDVNGDINTTGRYRIDGTQQGVWTSYTPTLYTGNYSGSPTHTLGSAGSITARYCVWGNVVFVQMDVSYGTFTSGNSTKQPRFSVPSGLRVVPTRGIGNTQGDFMGIGNMSGYMTHDYIGAMMAFNSGSHSSNGFIQWTQADSSSAGGNYNAYDAMYDQSSYFNDDYVTAYGRIVMSGWYRTDAL